MAVLNLRNLSEAVHRRLRIRAASRGRSMEAEAKEILQQVCGPSGQPASALPGWVARLYGGQTPAGVTDDLIAERRAEAARE